MTEEKFCSNCPQSHDCKSMYEQLGQAKGPSVALKAIVAFLSPIIIFIVAAAFIDRFLATSRLSENLRIITVAISAGVISFIWILICRAIIRRSAGRKKTCNIEGE